MQMSPVRKQQQLDHTVTSFRQRKGLVTRGRKEVGVDPGLREEPRQVAGGWPAWGRWGAGCLRHQPHSTRGSPVLKLTMGRMSLEEA